MSDDPEESEQFDRTFQHPLSWRTRFDQGDVVLPVGDLSPRPPMVWQSVNNVPVAPGNALDALRSVAEDYYGAPLAQRVGITEDGALFIADAVAWIGDRWVGITVRLRGDGDDWDIGVSTLVEEPEE